MSFSIYHKIAAKLGSILNAIILSSYPDLIGNAFLYDKYRLINEKI